MGLSILLSAFACEPDQGSEPAVGWHWALTLARLGHRVAVLTQGRNRKTIEPALGRVPPGVSFHYFEPPRAIGMLKHRLPMQLYHLLWQVAARGAAARLAERLAPDLVQHLTFCTIRQPSLLGSLPYPFVLGPVAGGETTPHALRAGLPARGRCLELLRDLANHLVRIDPVSRHAMSRAVLILAATPETARLVPERWQGKVVLASQIGIDPPADPPPRPPARELRLLFAGRFLYWKGVDLALDALALLARRGIELHLSMIGKGPEEGRWRARAAALGLADRVSWLGWLPQAALETQYRAHDALLFPSLHDSGGFAVLESLAHGLPAVCLRLGGPGRIVTAACGYAVDVESRDRAACALALADALADLHGRADRAALRQAALARAHELTWERVVGRAVTAIEAKLRPSALRAA
jgi:glycosyltransferase involved in cell wall biosynthesis